MKNRLYTVLRFLILLLTGCILLHAELFAQMTNITDSKKQPNESGVSLRGNPYIIFKIERGYGFHDNPLYLDLPVGASLQYNGNGIFQINNMPDIYEHYSIKLRSGGDILNGVSTADISLIQRHILGKGPFMNEYKFIAADVNCDGRISAKDMVEIRRAILGVTDRFECNTNFAFSPHTLEFEWNGSTLDLGSIIPIKLGDLNNSVKFNIESATNNNGN